MIIRPREDRQYGDFDCEALSFMFLQTGVETFEWGDYLRNKYRGETVVICGDHNNGKQFGISKGEWCEDCGDYHDCI
jgi:hypothetical protein